MKLVKRSTLMGLTIGLAVLLLVYTFLRTFTPIKLDESGERIAMNCIMFAALGIFAMNRQLAAQEKKEQEAKIEAEKAKEAESFLEQNDSEESGD